ncbi:rho GTPase-activating protein 24-like [Meleagris gallopavo]|uniref:rho GTPase-activating protein 24-like n=1 Tax=Meleagris gallopavo TaxID=9103 RepID=UPI00093CC154|nr:rho GTPase-activating protein 24-like [Meleagris gallopavo]
MAFGIRLPSPTRVTGDGTAFEPGSGELCSGGELLRPSMDEHNGSVELPPASQGRHGTIKCGWLRKQGGFVKTWHTRWFVLKGDQLYYFKDEDEIKPLVSDSPKVNISGVVTF